MALDICFDLKTFLECTCRACSRYFSCDAEVAGEIGKVQFHRIFATPEGMTSASVKENLEVGEIKEEKPSVGFAGEVKPSEEVREIYEELQIWKLNIKPGDGLPQQICHDCLERFRSVKLFREECLDTQKVLESYFRDFDTLLECATPGRLSPKTESSIKSEPRGSPVSFNTEDLIEEVAESPEQPLGSPKVRLSPRFQDAVYAESSMGTPPPLFEEIKTEPIDMQTMEYIKTEAELQLDAITKAEIKENREVAMEMENPAKISYNRPLSKTPPLGVGGFHFASSDDESSTPTSDEEDEVEEKHDQFSDRDSEFESNYRRRSTSNTRASNPLECKICFAVFSKRLLLREHHLRAHPSEKPYSCNICGSAFKSNFLLTQHKHKHNRPDTLKCSLCGKYFRSQLHLQRHAKNFHLTSTYTCHICNATFENYTQMRFQYHVRQHGEKRFRCQFCEKSFHQKVHLINHERTHSKDTPFRCDMCGKAYRQLGSLQEHMLTHSDPSPFKCKICQKGFAQRYTLRLHYRSHSATGSNNSKTNAYHCELCGQDYELKVHYEMHQLTQHAAGGVTTAREGNTHMKKLRKTFNCQYCDKTFKRKELQLLHEQQHKETQQQQHFECSFCSESFIYRSTLGQHMLTHLESENGEDDLMEYTFNTSI